MGVREGAFDSCSCCIFGHESSVSDASRVRTCSRMLAHPTSEAATGYRGGVIVIPIEINLRSEI